MGAMTIQQMADRVSGLLEEQLRLRGRDLAEKVQRGGRRLPRKVRVAALELAEAAALARNPKFMAQVDEARVAHAYDICVRHLAPMGALARWATRFSTMAAQIAFALVVVAALALLVMRARGLI